MARGNPVEFVRLNADGTYERVGNAIQIEAAIAEIETVNTVNTVTSVTTVDSITNPITLTVAPVAQGALTDRSGDIAVGATSEEVMPANASRRYMIIQNLSVSDVMWIDFGTDAVEDQPSLQLAANGGSFVMEGSFICTQAVNIICATGGEPYAAKEG